MSRLQSAEMPRELIQGHVDNTTLNCKELKPYFGAMHFFLNVDMILLIIAAFQKIFSTYRYNDNLICVCSMQIKRVELHNKVTHRLISKTTLDI